MNKFSFYFIKIFIKNLVAIFLFINTIQWLSSAYGNIHELQGREYAVIDLIILTNYGLILGINQIMPMIIAVTIIVTIISLMRSNELLAYMTIGGSLVKLLFPLIFIGITICFLMIFNEYKFVPDTRIVRQNMLETLKGNTVSNELKGFYNTWLLDSNNKLINIGLISITDKIVYDLKEYTIENNKIISIIKTEKLVKENNYWVAYNKEIIDLAVNPPKKVFLDKDIINDKIWDKFVSIKTRDIRGYTPTELYTLITLYRDKGMKTTELEIALYFKFALSLSVLVLLIVLYPISINFSRNYSIVQNATISLSIAIIFILVQHSFLSLGKSGALSPITAVFVPLIVFVLIGFYIIYYRRKAK